MCFCPLSVYFLLPAYWHPLSLSFCVYNVALPVAYLCRPLSFPVLFLVGLVVKASALSVADAGVNSHLCHEDFSRWSHTGDLTVGTPVETLLGTWHYSVSAGTGWPGVSIL